MVMKPDEYKKLMMQVNNGQKRLCCICGSFEIPVAMFEDNTATCSDRCASLKRRAITIGTFCATQPRRKK